jgi:hypothetical protein
MEPHEDAGASLGVDPMSDVWWNAVARCRLTGRTRETEGQQAEKEEAQDAPRAVPHRLPPVHSTAMLPPGEATRCVIGVAAFELW